MRRAADSVSSGSSLSTPVMLMLYVALALLLSGVLFLTSALAAAPGPGWSIQAVAQPTNLSPAGNDGYKLIVTNAGGGPSAEDAPVTIADVLPPGVRATRISGEEVQTGASLGCTTVPLQCVGGAVPASATIVVRIGVAVEEATEMPGTFDFASVSGGGAPAVTTTVPATFSAAPAPFGIADFGLQAFDTDGAISTQAGGHPYTLLTSLYFSSDERAPAGEGPPAPAEEVKDIIVDLPLGLVGNPQVRPKCPLWALLQVSKLTACPPASRVGTVLFEAEPDDTFRVSEGPPSSQTTAVYNMQPEAGFPAEFGFTFLGKAIYMYASTVRIDGQLRLRVTVPGIPELETNGATLMFFGDPSEHFQEGASPIPFFTNPVDCEPDAAPLTATAEVDSWPNPSSRNEHVFSSFAEATAYSQLSGCDVLQFQPTLAVRPDTTQADEPSGYTFTVGDPQNESSLTPGTPPLKDATVTLPAGVSLSPSAAEGLRACAATGPEGINIGSGQMLGAGLPGAGEDVGDREATEVGAGHFEGDGSPYDDGLYHTAPGHCPSASTIGTVEIDTPLLPSPLEGHLYVAQPSCGGAGQPPCTPNDALDGNLFGVYLEAAGSGTIVKLAGSASVNPSTGQITASFSETPQVPFSSLRLHFNGGPRAPLANSQACGPATTAAVFTAWSTPATLASQSFTPFTVDWDDAGGACPAKLPLTPSLTAETTNPAAGAFSPFSFTLSRGDRQQYLAQLSVTTPPGLLARIAGVPLCEEPQAAVGTCSAASEIGTATVAAGAGSQPLWVTGHMYLTGGYAGAPFGLSIVVPARAGPFDLGDVVVRSAITVNPQTSAVTITSAPLPQVIDGIPLRVQTVNVDVNRPGFMFNPTNCSAKQIAVTVLGSQGATAQTTSPFAAAGCKGLPFSPTFAVSTQARTSKANGASLDVKVASKPGQANIKAVAVTLPKQLPARLTTIQQACLAATFEANPAICPAGSQIGFVQARTPVLPVVLSGPAYLVSHGGAAFPDVVVILQGEDVRLELTGSINIAKGGITSSTFAEVPDAPVTNFEFKLPEGPHSALATNLSTKAKGDFCGTTLLVPTVLLGQNGLRITHNTKVTVSGCPKPKKKVKPKARPRQTAHRSGGRGR
jgi:hypothetical protein